MVDLNLADGRSHVLVLYSSMSHALCSVIPASVSMDRLNCGVYTAQQDIEFRMPRVGTPLLLPVQTRMAATRTIL